MHEMQAGNFLDKIVTFCVGMGIGKPAFLPSLQHIANERLRQP